MSEPIDCIKEELHWFLVDEVYENTPINDLALDLYQKYVWSVDDQNRDRMKEMKAIRKSAWNFALVRAVQPSSKMGKVEKEKS